MLRRISTSAKGQKQSFGGLDKKAGSRIGPRSDDLLGAGRLRVGDDLPSSLDGIIDSKGPRGLWVLSEAGQSWDEGRRWGSRGGSPSLAPDNCWWLADHPRVGASHQSRQPSRSIGESNVNCRRGRLVSLWFVIRRSPIGVPAVCRLQRPSKARRPSRADRRPRLIPKPSALRDRRLHVASDGARTCRRPSRNGWCMHRVL